MVSEVQSITIMVRNMQSPGTYGAGGEGDLSCGGLDQECLEENLVCFLQMVLGCFG